MPDVTVWVLMIALGSGGQRVGSVSSVKRLCDLRVAEMEVEKQQYAPDSKDEFSCIAWHVFTLDDFGPEPVVVSGEPKSSPFRCGWNLFWHRDCSGKRFTN